MPRGKAFDPDAALRKAMQIFWRQGYEATSIDDLVRVMGVNRASLYATYGDKRSLFRRALARYIATVLAPRLAATAESPSPLAGLRGLLGELVAFSAGDPQRRGCLAVNAACELAGREPEVAAMIKTQADALERQLASLIARAQARGELAGGRDAKSLARMLATVIDGVRVRAKLAPDRAEMESIVASALAALG